MGDDNGVSDQAGRSDAGSATRSAIRVRSFPRPPDGFDPLAASDRELLVHGFPGRPHDSQAGVLGERWREVVSRSKDHIQAEFVSAPKVSDGVSAAAPPNVLKSGWAGSTAQAPAVSHDEWGVVTARDPVTWVSGQWTVPDVRAVSDRTAACATWVGIDGARQIDSTDILQVGTTQAVISGQQQTYAWWEWYPNPPHRITNFPVFPGDVVFCLICAPESTGAQVYLTNVTTGKFVSFAITAEGGGWSLAGDTVEWILENPLMGQNSFADLPRFGAVYFDECVAGTRGNRLIFAGAAGSRVDSWIVGGSPAVQLATATAVTERVIKIGCEL